MIDPAPRNRRRQPIEKRVQIGAPDVPTVNDAKRQNQTDRGLGERDLELLRPANEIEMHSGDRQRQGEIEIVVEAAEIGRQHDLDLRHRLGEPRIGVAQRLAGRLIEIERQARLVHLHPLRPVGGEPTQHIHVDQRQIGGERHRIEGRVLAFPELQIRHGPEKNRPRLVAERFRLAILLDGLQTRQGEALIRMELGNHVVIVRVEPFRHFLRGRAMGMGAMRAAAAGGVMTLFLRAARHREVGFQRHGAALPAIDGGNRADHHAGVEDMVVE